MSKKSRRRKNRRNQHKAKSPMKVMKKADYAEAAKAKSLRTPQTPKPLTKGNTGAYGKYEGHYHGYGGYGRCHSHEAQLVCKSGGMSLWAGSRRSLEVKISKGNISPVLGINLSGMFVDFNGDFPVLGNITARNTLPKELFHCDGKSEPAIIDIEWDDMAVPIGLNKAWWEEMAKVIFEQKGDVAVCCVGGHGRTGTFLSIVMALGGDHDDSVDPVGYMRNLYCDSGVETERQIKYVETMTGRLVSEGPSDGGYFPYKVVGGSSVKKSTPATSTASTVRPDDKEDLGISPALQRAGQVGTESKGWTAPPTPGAADYEICQEGTSAYLDQLAEEELSYSYVEKEDEMVAEISEIEYGDEVLRDIQENFMRNPHILKGA